MSRLLWSVVGCLLLLLAACGAEPPPRPSPSSVAPPSSASSASSAASALVGRRDCAGLVDVGLGDVAWRRAPAAGPAAFAPLDYVWGDPAGFAGRAPDAQGWRRFKVPMRLRNGTSATVSIPAALRDVAALTYLNGFDHTVAFAACGDPSDPAPGGEFAGGFALRQPLCLPLDITWPGGTDRLILDFGKGTC